MTPALAIDLGGTNLRAALFETHAIAPDTVPPHLLQQAAPQNLDAFRQTVETLLDQTGAGALGIAVPGLVEGTVCRWAPNLRWLDDVDFAALFPDVRVAAGNDAQFSLLAEAAAGAARGADNAILLAIGTGIGSSLLADGRIVRGAGGTAVSFGWACARFDDAGDPQHGWLERHASGRALDRAAQGIGLADGAALVAAARHGEDGPRGALETVGQILGAALSGAVALTGTDRVVISGGVSSALDLFGPSLLHQLQTHLPPHLRTVSLMTGAFGSQAALCGAALAAYQHPIWEES